MPILIRKVSEEHGWLGNMSPFPVSLDDGKTEWRTAEALFQSTRFMDKDIIAGIRREKNPMAAKIYARHRADKMIVVPRSVADTDNMRLVLRAKLRSNPDLVERLKATGSEQIIEDCGKRRNDSGLFWGAALIEGEWVGVNKLGELWMHLRMLAQNDSL